MSSTVNIDRMMDALSVILSNKYGCRVTLKAVRKDNKTGAITPKAS